MNLSFQTRLTAIAGIMLVIFLLISAALFMPKVDRTVKVMDMLFVIDITQSMDVKDVEFKGQQISRLDWAKDYVRRTLLELPCGAHVGLSVFSEARSLILINPVEVCGNYNDLIQMLTKIDGPMAWVNSSEVSKALFTAMKQAQLIDSKPSIVFLTDGHESPPLHATLFPKYQGDLGIISGVIVGMGGDELLPIPRRDEAGMPTKEVWQANEVMQQNVYVSSRGDLGKENAQKAQTEHLSSQKKVHLTELAKRVEFEYLASPDDPDQLIDTLVDIAKTREQVVSYDWAPWLATLALILLGLTYLPVTLIRSA
ncbi:MAG: VWA domain-containing protein [Gammaproteobacteria bacterium]|nr:VWA domain-containing protein [Gammaproteobacteria bacterium]